MKRAENQEIAERWRTTLVIEAEANEGFEDALRHAVAAARERFIRVSFSLPKSVGNPRVECRTAKVRRRLATA